MGIDYTKRADPAPSPGAGTGTISLTKRGQKVELRKDTGSGQPIRVNLNWRQPAPAKGGLLKQRPAAIDLDLGCLFELADGRTGAVQALGNSFGSIESPPYVQLDKDDRSGQATDGENLFINGARAADIRRVLVYAFIYEGVARWSEADAIVTIHPPSGEPVQIRLDEHADGTGMCGICLIEGGQTLSVERQVVYVAGHRNLDERFGWGLSWKHGRK
jgi:tellurite resistance protein TerA